MAKQIKYLEVDKETYEQYEWKRDDVDDFLAIYTIISIETLQETIKFWYNKEQ